MTFPPALSRVRMLLLDVDGVLTNGAIIYSDSGEEIKHFNVKDGLGIRMLLDNGIGVGIVTARTSRVLLHRCKNLGIEMIFDGVSHKGDVLPAVLHKTGLSAEQVAFMGDDLPDLSLLRLVGTRIAVADAAPEIKEIADLVTARPGGCGAVREACEAILKSTGLWDRATEKYRC